MKLLFIRHAQSTGNQERRMQGHGDYELSSHGRFQAEKLAQALLAEGWFPTHVYSSPLKRAAQTTEILINHFLTAPLPAAVSDLIDGTTLSPGDAVDRLGRATPIQYADELKEFQNGIFQGLTWAEAQAQYPELCLALESSPDWLPIPGAESLEEARSRSRAFIDRLLATHGEDDRIWITTHSWILQHLIATLMDCPRSWRLRAQNTALFEFWIDRTRWNRQDGNQFNTDLWQVRRFNDCRHLAF